jgi:3-hydroxyacyl-CoA dehydrogenase, C-terminal domain
MIKTGVIIDHTGLASSIAPHFDQLYTQWRVLESEAMLGDVMPDLIVLMQLPASIPAHWTMPILINDTIASFSLNKSDTRPIARFCGWNTMVERPSWEIAMYNDADTGWMQDAEKMLNRTLTLVKNTPGFVAPRVVASIINEACYGLADNICSASDMDLAMKLGTNYPQGPLAWMQQIGKQEIHALLSHLAIAEKRYTPHPFLSDHL